MAIINSFTSNGVTYPQAYIQVSYHKLNSKETVLQLLAWTSEDARHSGAKTPWTNYSTIEGMCAGQQTLLAKGANGGGGGTPGNTSV
jgi:hypothetical protein